MEDSNQDRTLEIGEAMHEMTQSMDGVDATMRAQIEGTALALVDVLVAIHTGTSWRGHTDPKDIAGAHLKQMGVVETKED